MARYFLIPIACYIFSTPSSKKPVKNNTLKSGEQKNRGGAKVGHKGNGRRSVSAGKADRVENVKLNCNCNSDNLEQLDQRERTVI
ncbi:MAG: hypothetical protein SCK70_09055, partial [bacterium]|nr:hypothetical protein [bacterium]